MDNETTRTLITAISAVSTTDIVALFGWLLLARKNKMDRLKKDLVPVYRQFGLLYQCEANLLEMLENAGKGNKVTIKAENRKKIIGDSDQKITLTDESVKKKNH